MCLVGRQDLVGYDAETWLCLIGLVLGAQLLGHTLVNRVLRTISPTVVSVAILFEIVGATVMARIWFGETPPAGVWPAAMLIAAGVVVVVRSLSRRQSSSTRRAESGLSSGGADHDPLRRDRGQVAVAGFGDPDRDGVGAHGEVDGADCGPLEQLVEGHDASDEPSTECTTSMGPDSSGLCTVAAQPRGPKATWPTHLCAGVVDRDAGIDRSTRSRRAVRCGRGRWPPCMRATARAPILHARRLRDSGQIGVLLPCDTIGGVQHPRACPFRRLPRAARRTG